MGGETRHGRCWFCGEAHLRHGDPPEHIIPAAIGGTLTTDRVAYSCNNELGKSIDQPFLKDVIVAMDRAFFDIRDPRRHQDRPPPNPEHKAELEDGTEIKIEMRGGPWRPILRPGVEQVDDRTYHVTASSAAEAERIMEKRLDRLRRDGVDVSGVEITQQRTHRAASAKVTMMVDPTIRLRASAKIALGILSKVLPDEWLDSNDAERLFGWLRDAQPKLRDGKGETIALPREVPEVLDDIVRPPEHLIFSMADGRDAIGLWIVLFGHEVLVDRFELGGLQRPNKFGWAMDPKKRTLTETDIERLSLRKVVALMKREGQPVSADLQALVDE